jgi:hypothetical protein
MQLAMLANLLISGFSGRGLFFASRFEICHPDFWSLSFQSVFFSMIMLAIGVGAFCKDWRQFASADSRQPI